VGDGAFEAVRARIEQDSARNGRINLLLNADADLAKLARILGWGAEPAAPVPRWPAALSPRIAQRAASGPRRSWSSTTTGLHPTPWQVPTNFLRDPLVGFTAIQQADAWLGRLAFFAPFITGWPRQLFLWSVAGELWNQYGAGPVQNPTTSSPRSRFPCAGTWSPIWTGLTLVAPPDDQRRDPRQFLGIPYLIPFLEAVRDGSVDDLRRPDAAASAGPARPRPFSIR
jgi:hypothetical protein